MKMEKLNGDHPIKEIILYDQTLEEIMLLNEAGNEFSEEKDCEWNVKSCIFWKCVNDFWCANLFRSVFTICPITTARISTNGEIDPLSEIFLALSLKSKRI